ncbi:MAG: hypothetical protein SO324_15390 [Thomasclavelia ramosa]|mgnify:CR=1 FL=1|jgi:hypothetical protein|nr:hypothetical protein [Thomasclavelia ramosa]DAR30619.1 MAG TPA: hypothetical protein [Caudoviricetes sp.]
MSKYQEAKDNIVNTLARQIDYKTYKNLYSEDFDTLQELVDKATPKNPILSKAWKVKMTAKEMFEELGFYITIYNDGEIIIWTNRDIDCKISFYEHDKEYGVFGCCYINLEIHNAITTQLKELGWI